MQLKYSSLICLMLLTLNTIAQKPGKKFLQDVSEDKTQFKQFNLAQTHFDEGNFADALEEFLNLQNEFPNQPFYDYMAAVGYILVGENYAEAAALLEKTKKADPYLEDLNYYLGKAYQLNGEYEKAIVSFNAFISEGIKKDKEIKALKAIEECNNAAKNNIPATDARIENLGAPVNSVYNEYVPLISSDESVLIFTYRGERSKGGKQNEFHEADPYGHYYEDVFVSYKLGTNWLEPEGISETINTTGHDACVGLSADGQHLFLFKSTTKDGGDLYESFFDGNDWSSAKNLGPIINSKYWEGSASLSADGQTLYFSSDRPGGFGGKDLYKAVKQTGGNWGKPINLGATINTKYDEDSPFIHPDGVSFYFSSKGHNTIGGYDIFKSTLESGNFSSPENIGSPVNTTGNDIFYVVNASGLIGYYSSGKSGGMGLQDIYRVSPGITGKLPVLSLFKGSTLFNGKPLAATLKVTDITNNVNKGSYTTNNVTAKYMIALPKGSEYKIEVITEKTKPIIQILNLKELDQFVDIVLDLEIDKLLRDAESPAGQHYLQSVVDNKIKEIKDEQAFQKARNAANNVTLANEEQEKQVKFMSSPMFSEMLKIYGDKHSAGTVFKIELSGVTDTLSPSYVALKKQTKIEQIVSANGTTHYVCGNFKTINEAVEYRKQLIEKEPVITQSFVSGYENNTPIALKQHFAKQMKMGAGIMEKQDITSVNQEKVTNASSVSATVNNSTNINTTEIPTEKIVASEEVKKGENVTETTTSENKLNNTSTAVSVTNDSVFAQRQQAQLNYMSSTSYEQIIEKYRTHTKPGVKFSVEIVSDQSTDSKTYLALNRITDIREIKDAKGNIHHTTVEFNTLEEADNYRKKLIVTNPEIGNSFVTVNDNSSLRTVKDYFKETMLAQMGIAPRPEESNSKIAIVSNENSITEKPSASTNVKQELNVSKPVAKTEVSNNSDNPSKDSTFTVSSNNTQTVTQDNKLNSTMPVNNDIKSAETSVSESNLIFRELVEEYDFLKTNDYPKIINEKGNYTNPEIKFYLLPVRQDNSNLLNVFKRLADYEIFKDSIGQEIIIAGNYSTLSEAINYRTQLKLADAVLDSTVIRVKKGKELIPVKNYFEELDKLMAVANKEISTNDKIRNADTTITQNNLTVLASNKTEIVTENIKTVDSSAVKQPDAKLPLNQPFAAIDTASNTKVVKQELVSETNKTPTDTLIINKEVKDGQTEANKSNYINEITNKKTEIKVNDEGTTAIDNKTAVNNSNSGELATVNNLSYYLNKDLNNPVYYNQLIENFGKNNPNGIVYKVQIGAYRFPKNFKYDVVKPLGDVAVTPYPDGITRFTQREHNTLEEAEMFRQTLIKTGIKDAWVTAFINGKRYLLQDLIQQGLLVANGL